MASHKAPRLYDNKKFNTKVAIVTVLLLVDMIELIQSKVDVSPGGICYGK